MDLTKKASLNRKVLSLYLNKENKDIRAYESSSGDCTVALSPECVNGTLIEYKPCQDVNAGQVVEPRVQAKYGEAAFSCYAISCLQKRKKLPTKMK